MLRATDLRRPAGSAISGSEVIPVAFSVESVNCFSSSMLVTQMGFELTSERVCLEGDNGKVSKLVALGSEAS